MLRNGHVNQRYLIPQCERGDIIAVMNTGAYNYSMASHYNRLAVPAVVSFEGRPCGNHRKTRLLRKSCHQRHGAVMLEEE